MLVLDAEAKAGPAVVRALGREGYCVIAAAAERSAPALRSRYVSQRMLHPHPGKMPGAFAAWIERAIAELRPDCVLPMTDCSMQVIDHKREQLSQRTRIALPAHESMEIANNKHKALALAESLGVDVPATWRPADAGDAKGICEHLRFPAYVKSRASYGNHVSPSKFARGRFAHDAADCMQTWKALHELVPLPLIQDAVPGPMVAVGGVWDAGRPVRRFCYAAQSCWPLSGGQSVARRSIPESEAPIEQAERLMSALQWTGPAHVQFIHDTRDGKFRLMEINGRFWGSLDAAHHSGADIAVAAAQLALGTHPEPKLEYRKHVRSRSIEGDMKRLFAVAFQRRRWQSESLSVPCLHHCFFDLLRGFLPTVHGDDMYLDDPRVGFMLMKRAFARAIGTERTAGEPTPLKPIPHSAYRPAA